jgi:predicted N-acetyltransferase YhbS
MVMVGPVAVEPGRQQGGIGRALMERMLDAVAAGDVEGADKLMLVGDPEYYGRFFAFTAERTGGWRLPGPFEARRLLARGDAVPDCTGILGPRPIRRAA